MVPNQQRKCTCVPKETKSKLTFVGNRIIIKICDTDSITSEKKLEKCKQCCQKGSQWTIGELFSFCEENPDCLINMFRISRIHEKCLPEICLAATKKNFDLEDNKKKSAGEQKYHYLMVDDSTSCEESSTQDEIDNFLSNEGKQRKSNKQYNILQNPGENKIGSKNPLMAEKVLKMDKRPKNYVEVHLIDSKTKKDLRSYNARKKQDFSEDDIVRNIDYEKPELSRKTEFLNVKSEQENVDPRNLSPESQVPIPKHTDTASKDVSIQQRTQSCLQFAEELPTWMEEKTEDKVKSVVWLEDQRKQSKVSTQRSQTSSSSHVLSLLQHIVRKQKKSDKKDSETQLNTKRHAFEWLPCLKWFNKNGMRKKSKIYENESTSTFTIWGSEASIDQYY